MLRQVRQELALGMGVGGQHHEKSRYGKSKGYGVVALSYSFLRAV
jgi:hypothetical protein